MRGYLKKLIKQTLFRTLGRDYFILNPAWISIGTFGASDLIGPATVPNNMYRLPVRYNYHTPPNWNLHYDIKGNSSGRLRFSLSTPNEPPFCQLEFNTDLPFSWVVRLDGDSISGNNTVIPIVDGRTIPKTAVWLVGEFEFYSEQQGVLYRKTGHRVKLNKGALDASYFEGLVYHSYEKESAHYPQEILDIVRRYHTLVGRLLDVGCATGLLVEYALNQGMDAEGVDCSSWAIEKANARVLGSCRILDFDGAAPSDFQAPYDVIILHSVIEHLADPERALKLLFSLCRPDGVVYIQTLNADSLMHTLMKEDWGGFTDYTHKSPWITADWLSSTSQRLGFEILHLRRYHIWNDNGYDDVWRSFAVLIQTYPASVILEDHFGDIVEVVLRKPHKSDSYVAAKIFPENS